MATASIRPRGRPSDPQLRLKRHDEILDVAARVFARAGYAAADVQQVADEVGVGKGTIYRNFPSKEQLFLAAVDRGMERLRSHVDEATAKVDDSLDKISCAVEAYLAFFDENPEYAELIILERAVFKNRRKPTYFQHRAKNIGRWHEIYRGLIAEGRIRPIEPERITDAISSAVYGQMFTNYFAGRQRPLAAQAVNLLDVIFRGILTDKEGSKACRKGRRAEGQRHVR